MAALDGALAFAEVDHVAVMVAEDLDFDVAGALDEALDIDLGGVESPLGFTGGVAEGGFEVALSVDAAHAFAAATGHGFEQDGEAVGGGEVAQGVEGDGVVGARDDGCAGGDSGAAGGGLGAHGADGGGGWPDEGDAGGFAGGGEIGVFAEESVAGVDGVGVMAAGGVEDAVDAEGAFGGGAGADVGGLVGHADVEGGAVGVGEDGDAGDAHFAERADDADGDLAAIGDQDLAEHADGIVAGRGGGDGGGEKSELRSDWRAEARPTTEVRGALGLAGGPAGPPPAPPRKAGLRSCGQARRLPGGLSYYGLHWQACGRHHRVRSGVDVGLDRVEEAPAEVGFRGRGQTGLAAKFRQTAPEIHASLVSPRRRSPRRGRRPSQQTRRGDGRSYCTLACRVTGGVVPAWTPCKRWCVACAASSSSRYGRSVTSTSPML